MAKKQVRRIGEEILEGLREIKRGEVGRVVTYPPVADKTDGDQSTTIWIGAEARPFRESCTV
jgi:hypothetical protein